MLGHLQGLWRSFFKNTGCGQYYGTALGTQVSLLAFYVIRSPASAFFQEQNTDTLRLGVVVFQDGLHQIVQWLPRDAIQITHPGGASCAEAARQRLHLYSTYFLPTCHRTEKVLLTMLTRDWCL